MQGQHLCDRAASDRDSWRTPFGRWTCNKLCRRFVADSFHIGRTGFHLQDRVADAPRTGGRFVNICPVDWSATVEQSCITDEIGAGQIETIRTPGHAIVASYGRVAASPRESVHGIWNSFQRQQRRISPSRVCTGRGPRQSACPLLGPTSRLLIRYKS
jgi:hypothetical protein